MANDSPQTFKDAIVVKEHFTKWIDLGFIAETNKDAEAPEFDGKNYQWTAVKINEKNEEDESSEAILGTTFSPKISYVDILKFMQEGKLKNKFTYKLVCTLINSNNELIKKTDGTNISNFTTMKLNFSDKIEPAKLTLIDEKTNSCPKEKDAPIIIDPKLNSKILAKSKIVARINKIAQAMGSIGWLYQVYGEGALISDGALEIKKPYITYKSILDSGKFKEGQIIYLTATIIGKNNISIFINGTSIGDYIKISIGKESTEYQAPTPQENQSPGMRINLLQKNKFITEITDELTKTSSTNPRIIEIKDLNSYGFFEKRRAKFTAILTEEARKNKDLRLFWYAVPIKDNYATNERINIKFSNETELTYKTLIDLIPEKIQNQKLYNLHCEIRNIITDRTIEEPIPVIIPIEINLISQPSKEETLPGAEELEKKEPSMILIDETTNQQIIDPINIIELKSNTNIVAIPNETASKKRRLTFSWQLNPTGISKPIPIAITEEPVLSGEKILSSVKATGSYAIICDLLSEGIIIRDSSGKEISSFIIYDIRELPEQPLPPEIKTKKDFRIIKLTDLITNKSSTKFSEAVLIQDLGSYKKSQQSKTKIVASLSNDLRKLKNKQFAWDLTEINENNEAIDDPKLILVTGEPSINYETIIKNTKLKYIKNNYTYALDCSLIDENSNLIKNKDGSRIYNSITIKTVLSEEIINEEIKEEEPKIFLQKFSPNEKNPEFGIPEIIDLNSKSKIKNAVFRIDAMLNKSASRLNPFILWTVAKVSESEKEPEEITIALTKKPYRLRYLDLVNSAKINYNTQYNLYAYLANEKGEKIPNKENNPVYTSIEIQGMDSSKIPPLPKDNEEVIFEENATKEGERIENLSEEPAIKIYEAKTRRSPKFEGNNLIIDLNEKDKNDMVIFAEINDVIYRKFPKTKIEWTLKSEISEEIIKISISSEIDNSEIIRTIKSKKLAVNREYALIAYLVTENKKVTTKVLNSQNVEVFDYVSIDVVDTIQLTEEKKEEVSIIKEKLKEPEKPTNDLTIELIERKTEEPAKNSIMAFELEKDTIIIAKLNKIITNDHKVTMLWSISPYGTNENKGIVENKKVVLDSRSIVEHINKKGYYNINCEILSEGTPILNSKSEPIKNYITFHITDLNQLKEQLGFPVEEITERTKQPAKKESENQYIAEIYNNKTNTSSKTVKSPIELKTQSRFSLFETNGKFTLDLTKKALDEKDLSYFWFAVPVDENGSEIFEASKRVVLQYGPKKELDYETIENNPAIKNQIYNLHCEPTTKGAVVYEKIPIFIPIKLNFTSKPIEKQVKENEQVTTEIKQEFKPIETVVSINGKSPKKYENAKILKNEDRIQINLKKKTNEVLGALWTAREIDDETKIPKEEKIFIGNYDVVKSPETAEIFGALYPTIEKYINEGIEGERIFELQCSITDDKENNRGSDKIFISLQIPKQSKKPEKESIVLIESITNSTGMGYENRIQLQPKSIITANLNESARKINYDRLKWVAYPVTTYNKVIFEGEVVLDSWFGETKLDNRRDQYLPYPLIRSKLRDGDYNIYCLPVDKNGKEILNKKKERIAIGIITISLTSEEKTVRITEQTPEEEKLLDYNIITITDKLTNTTPSPQSYGEALIVKNPEDYKIWGGLFRNPNAKIEVILSKDASKLKKENRRFKWAANEINANDEIIKRIDPIAFLNDPELSYYAIKYLVENSKVLENNKCYLFECTLIDENDQPIKNRKGMIATSTIALIPNFNLETPEQIKIPEQTNQRTMETGIINLNKLQNRELSEKEKTEQILTDLSKLIPEHYQEWAIQNRIKTRKLKEYSTFKGYLQYYYSTKTPIAIELRTRYSLKNLTDKDLEKYFTPKLAEFF